MVGVFRINISLQIESGMFLMGVISGNKLKYNFVFDFVYWNIVICIKKISSLVILALRLF